MSGDKVTRDIELVNDWFTYHTPTAGQQEALGCARGYFKALALYLVKNVADSRERAIALTEMRKAAMVVNQAIIFDRTL